jgi:hypothetical protein
VLLAAAVVLALEARWQGLRRGGFRLVWVLAGASSALFAVLASIQHNDLLRINHPSVYAPLARRGNLLSYGFDRLVGTRYGPLELRLKLPMGRSGKLEPILVSGIDFKSDFLYVFYVDPRHVIFGFEHTGYGGVVSESVEVDYAREHTLYVELGALYPPRDHPYFAGLTPAAVDDRLRRIRLRLDDEWLLDDPADCYDPVRRRPLLGFSPESDALGRKFSGVISGPHRAAVSSPVPFGALRLLVELPKGKSGASEPLLTTGLAGRGDLVRIVYVDAGHVRLVHDRWGFGGSSSPDIPVDYGTRHRLELSLGSLFPDGPWTTGISPERLAQARRRVVLKVDGVAALEVDEPSHPAAPGTVAIGSNAIGASLVQPAFTGTVLQALRGWK